MLSVPQRYRQTDRRTDGRTTYDSSTALALRASRGNKQSCLAAETSPFLLSQLTVTAPITVMHWTSLFLN